MTEETVAKIEAAIKGAHAVDHKDKAKLIALLEQLKRELRNERRSPGLIDSVNEKLVGLAGGMEIEHPQLAAVVNEVSMLLAKIGI